MRDAHRELGKISSVEASSYRDEAGAPNTVWVQVEFPGSSQGFGGMCLDAEGIAAFIAGLCDACGVKDRERLVGRRVFALRAFSTWNEPIAGIEDLETGRRFTRCGFRRSMGYPSESEYDAELKRIDDDVAHMQRQTGELRARRQKLRDDYVEWD